MSRRPGPLDLLAGAALLALTAAYAGFFLSFSRHPEEDAAMLLRYSGHLAAGHGVVWNVGERPLDGATDFLFMVAVALLHGMGWSLEGAARAVGLASHALTVIAVYAAIRATFGAGRALALLPAAYLAVGPAMRYVAACYGTPVFALTVCAAWWAACHAALSPAGALPGRAALLGALSVLMGLARPEGAFLGLFFVLAVAGARARHEAPGLFKAFAAPFVIVGLAYFLWRWSYFGQPLPNPFYRKAGGLLHWDVLARAVRNLARLGGPFLAVILAGLIPARSRRPALFALGPTAGFAALWILVSDETNYFMRFRYPILPVILISWVPVWQAWDLGPRLAGVAPLRAHRRVLAAGAAALVAVALVLIQHRQYRRIEPERMGLYDAAIVLRDYAGRGYALATTEAGLLPLYSGWRAVDAWGLNDRWIARHGLVTEDYLDRYRPEVIVFHAYFSPGLPEEGPRVEGRGLGRPWFLTVSTLKRYAEVRGYRLAAVFGRNPYDTHYYYVRAGLPEAAQIADRIRGLRYVWAGAPTANYAPAE